MSGSSIQERHKGTGRTRQAALAAVAFVSLLLAALLGGLSLRGTGGCGGKESAVALRHEQETLLARQLEQFSCIRQVKVQLAPQSWQLGAVIVLEPSRPEAMPDAAALDRMLDVLALVPDGPDKRHVLVFDTEGRRLYPDRDTDETARREQEVALERQALRVLRPCWQTTAGQRSSSAWRERARKNPGQRGAVRSRSCWRKMPFRRQYARILRACWGRPVRWRRRGAIRCGSVSCQPGGMWLYCGAWPWLLPCWLWPAWPRSFGRVAALLSPLFLPGCRWRAVCRVRLVRTAERRIPWTVCVSRWRPVSVSIPGMVRPCCATGWRRKMA